MITVRKSLTADTRTCDWSSVTKDQLQASSEQHIGDVKKGLDFFKQLIDTSISQHDFDKLTNLAGFYADFITGFKQTTWWDEHRKLNRHHLLQDDGIPVDVNLIDVLDMLTDCVMAGMTRAGSVYSLEITPALLKRAFDNTVSCLQAEVIIADDTGSNN